LAIRQFLPSKYVDLKEDGKDSSFMRKTEFCLSVCRKNSNRQLNCQQKNAQIAQIAQKNLSELSKLSKLL